jgi:hypothetical protein
MGIKFSYESVRYIKHIYETGENYIICISYNIHTYIIMSYRISVVPPKIINGTVSDLEDYLNNIRNKIVGNPFSYKEKLCVLSSVSPLASHSSASRITALSDSAADPSRPAADPSRQVVDPWRSTAHPSGSAAYPSYRGRGGKSRARKGYNKYMKKTRKRN